MRYCGLLLNCQAGEVTITMLKSLIIQTFKPRHFLQFVCKEYVFVASALDIESSCHHKSKLLAFLSGWGLPFCEFLMSSMYCLQTHKARVTLKASFCEIFTDRIKISKEPASFSRSVLNLQIHQRDLMIDIIMLGAIFPGKNTRQCSCLRGQTCHIQCIEFQ